MAAAKGNRYAAHDKPWQRALQRAVQQDPDKLRRIALKTLDMAEEGDISAMREIGDRLDGKPAQSMDISGSLNTGKTAAEVSDDQLANIATGSGAGIVESQEGPQTLN